MDNTIDTLFLTNRFGLSTTGFTYTTKRQYLSGNLYSKQYLLVEVFNDNYKVSLLDFSNCYNAKDKTYNYCAKTIEKSKTIYLNINYINENVYNETIEEIKNELNQKEDYNDFSNYMDEVWTSKSNLYTTPQQIKKVSKHYNFMINYSSYAGSDIVNNNDDIDVGCHRDFIYIIRDDIIYDIIYDAIFIDTTLGYNGYLPKLKLENYYDVDMYIEDALRDFPQKAHLNNYEIIKQSDGKQYKKNVTDGINRYEVSIKDLDDDINWTMYFSGELGEKPSEEDLKGDMNGNGRIDLQDIILLLRKYLRLS